MIDFTIDFNKETIPQLVDRITKEGHSLDNCRIILTAQQFENFKIMYRVMRINFNRFDASEPLFAENNGIIYGVEYKVI